MDVRLIATAVSTLDAALLTDAALQLAEGERVLLRSHKGLPAQGVIQAAVKLASQKRDKASLERLAKFAMLTKNEELGKQVKTNLDLAMASRTAPALMIPADTRPEQLSVYKGLIAILDSAVLLHDAKGVSAVAEDVKKLEKGALPDKLTADLEKRIKEAETNVKSASPTDTQKALSMLQSARALTGGCIVVGTLMVHGSGTATTSNTTMPSSALTSSTAKGSTPCSSTSTTRPPSEGGLAPLPAGGAARKPFPAEDKGGQASGRKS